MGIQKYYVKRKHTVSYFSLEEFWTGFRQTSLNKHAQGAEVGPSAHPLQLSPDLPALSLAKALSTTEVLGARQMVTGLSVDPEKPQKCP